MRRMAAVLAAALLLPVLLSGCAGSPKVVFTTGFKKDEIFRIADASCSLTEAMVYLTNMQNRYETVYGEEIWNVKENGESLEQEAKKQVLSELAQVKIMTLLAQEKEIVLEEKDQERVAAAAKEYFASLNETEKKLLNVDEKRIAQMYREYALAEKVYHEIVDNVNPEISDDEARTITVLLIRVKDAAEAQQVWQKTQEEGSSFETLAELYSEDTSLSYSFGKGEMDEAIETAAFNLGKNEISDVIAAGDGYYILKCISTFEEEQTQLNKEKIVERRRSEAFSTEYDTFAASLVRQLNEEVWDTVALLHDENVQTDSFFSVYNTYFQIENGV